MAATKSKTPAQKGSKAGNKFFIDFAQPSSDGIMDGAAFEKYLHDHIKVDNKAGQLGDAIKVTREGESKQPPEESKEGWEKKLTDLLVRDYLRRGKDLGDELDSFLQAIPQVPVEAIPEAISAQRLAPCRGYQQARL
jgi:hypothetical protein